MTSAFRRLAGLLAVVLPLAGCSKREAHKEDPASPSGSRGPLPIPEAIGEPLTSGDELPEVSAIAHTGARVDVVDYRGRVLLIFFCSSLSSERCTALTEWLRQRWSELRELDAAVLGVTRDHRLPLRERAYQLELPFYLLADPRGRLFDAFGVQEAGQALVVDSDGEVQKRLAGDSPADLGDRSLRLLDSLSRESG